MNAENDNVVLFGRVVSVGEGEFVIDIARPAATNDGAEILWSEVLPGRGVSGRPLPISTGINTTFSGGSLANLEVGTPVMLGGQLREGRLDAHFVVDARGLQVDASQLREAVPSATWQPGPPLSLPPSLLEKTGVSVHDRVNAPATERTLEFPGSFGGPSWAADSGHLGIPVSLVPYIEIDRIKPVVGLAGGHYNFPFALGAMAPNTLVVGQDGNVQIKVEPKSPENEPYSYYWALGFNFEFVFNFCGFEGLFPPEWVCHSYSYDASVLSQVCATDKPAPMPGETLDIPHLACPGFGIEIEGTPISLIEVQVCQDQSFVGDCFWANVFHSPCDFGRTPREFSVRPFTNPLSIDLRDFEYHPALRMGLSMQLAILTIPVWDTPTLADLVDGDVTLIPTDSPDCSSFFEVSTCGNEQESNMQLLLPAIPVVTSVASAPTPTRFGEMVTLEALVRGANGPGNSPKEVRFYDGDTHLATVPIDAQDTATLRIATLDPCKHVITAKYIGYDDEGVAYPSERSVVQIVTGDAVQAFPEGYWQHQCRANGATDCDPASVQCYIEIVDHLSTVFGEMRGLSTAANAFDILYMQQNNGQTREQLDRELLCLWLNFANGAIRYRDSLDIDEDGIGDISFAELVAAAERVRLDPEASVRDLKEQIRWLHQATKRIAPTGPGRGDLGAQ